MEVYIDGIKYVPAKEVIVNADKFMIKLLEQFWGYVDESKIEKSRDLRVLVSDSLSENQGESIDELFNRLSDIK